MTDSQLHKKMRKLKLLKSKMLSLNKTPLMYPI